ncbi:MAG: hypothetical protein PHZ02_01260 [Desulfocapsaceae bacterium]|nr:hypothetical protein [Desulfocapsaceae bacterium]
MAETAINMSRKTRLLFSGVKNQEALRKGKTIPHEDFILFLTELYKRVSGDTIVLDDAWEKAKKEIGR